MAAVAFLAFACSSGSSSTKPADGGADAADAPTDARGESEAETPARSACVTAGGQCVQGVAYCAMVGPGATPGSCLDVGPTMLCCALNADAGCAEIQASSYDQSCANDSDCVTVNVGDPCEACVFACGENVSAINASAMARYKADVDKTPAAVALCGCPAFLRPPPCCRGGQCHADNECVPLDGSTDGADANPE